MLKVVRNLISCVCLLLVLAFLFLGAPTHAADLNASVGINPSLTLTLPTADLNLSLNPATTTFGYKDLPISISTNNETGYIMTVTTADDNTNLVNTSDSNVVLETLPTLAGGYTDSTFVVNKWGYKNGLSNNYFPFTSGATVLENSTYTNEDSTTLRFATKIDYMQEEGTYSTTFSFNLVVNPTYKTMQNLDPTLCTATPREVLDERDNRTYYIQRLQDGNCWMLNNLRLGQDTTTVALTTADSDVQSGGFTLNNKLSDGKFTYTTVSGVNFQNNNPQYYCTEAYGCYYNWYTATASSGTTSVSSGNVDYSICPAGWKLPTSTQYQGLIDNYTPATALFVNPTSATENIGGAFAPGILLSGAYQNAGGIYIGQNGNYWVSTGYNAQRAMSFLSSTTSASVEEGFSKFTGLPIRCILKDTRTISDIRNMQDINAQIVANTANGTTKSLKDTRDNHSYTVAKIDGKLHMTTNLALGCNGSTITPTTLDPADSNIRTSWTTPTNSLTISTDSNTDPRMECSNTYGAYYNYPAASAGTITGASTTAGTYDVCPKGWRLPIKSEQTALMTALSSDLSLWGLLDGGMYMNGANVNTNKGYWWASTVSSAGSGSRDGIYYQSSALAYDYLTLSHGFYIRCVAK
ncbi:hypothetical protein IKG07_02165 [Candidatus Saccharibacteria bacterium]|nr:hypothetical protein [Candidatus Saccharibacteria bacterium]